MTGNIFNRGHFNTAARRILVKGFENAGLQPYAGYDVALESAKIFLSRLRPTEKRLLKSTMKRNYPGFEDFMFTNPKGREALFVELDGLNFFVKAVYDELTKRQLIFPEETGVERRRLPEPSAFEYAGMNDLKISDKPSNYVLSY